MSIGWKIGRSAYPFEKGNIAHSAYWIGVWVGTTADPNPLEKRKKTSNSAHWMGSWEGTRAILYTLGEKKNPCPYEESNPYFLFVQPVRCSLHWLEKHIISYSNFGVSGWMVHLNLRWGASLKMYALYFCTQCCCQENGVVQLPSLWPSSYLSQHLIHVWSWNVPNIVITSCAG